MKLFVAKTLLFILILIVFGGVILNILDERFKHSTTNKYMWLLQHENQEFDFVIHGSSRVNNMFDAKLFEERTGMATINSGIGGAGMADNYLLLYLFLKKNRVKNVLFQIDAFSLDSKNSFSDPFHEYAFIPFINDSIVENTIRRESTAGSFLWSVWPETAYIEFNSEYGINHLVSSYRKHSPFDKRKGYTENNERAFESDGINYPITKKIDEIDILYFKKIIYLCQQKNINLLLFTAPILAYEKHFRTDLSDQLIKDFSREFHLRYLDEKRNPKFQHESYFKDITHLNKEGTHKFTIELAEKIVGQKVNF